MLIEIARDLLIGLVGVRFISASFRNAPNLRGRPPISSHRGLLHWRFGFGMADLLLVSVSVYFLLKES